jgi:hypothetical protein
MRTFRNTREVALPAEVPQSPNEHVPLGVAADGFPVPALSPTKELRAPQKLPSQLIGSPRFARRNSRLWRTKIVSV